MALFTLFLRINDLQIKMQSSSLCLKLEVGISTEKILKLVSKQTNSELYVDVLGRCVAFLVFDLIDDKRLEGHFKWISSAKFLKGS